MAEWQGFYSVQRVSRITGVPTRTIYRWAEEGTIVPAMEMRNEHGQTVKRGYSYAQVAIIKIVRALHEDKLDFRSVAIALQHLYERFGPPGKGWANQHVYILGSKVVGFKDDEWDHTVANEYGQKIETRLWGDLFDELRRLDEDASILVPEQFRKHIQINPKVMGGEPSIKGTRIPTASIAALHKKGRSLAKLAELYRPVPAKAIRMALEYEEFLDKQTA